MTYSGAVTCGIKTSVRILTSVSPDSPSPPSRFRRRAVLSLSAASLTTALAGCSSLQQKFNKLQLPTPERQIPADWEPNPGEWPRFGYGHAGTRHNPFATPPREQPEAVWTFADVTERILSLVVSQDAVFARTRAELVAIDKESGQERWRKQRDDWAYVHFIEGRLYDVSREAVVALDADGTELWSVSIEKFHHAGILERDGWVYVLARNRFACVHADSGAILVETALDDDEMGPYFPVTDGRRIFAGESRLFGYEVDDNRLEKQWESRTAPYRLYGVIATDSGLVFRPDFNIFASDVAPGRLSIHDVKDGSLRAEQTFETVPRSPATVDGTVFVSTSTVSAGNIGNDGKLVALSYEGESLWEYTPEASLQPPVVANDTLYTGPFSNREVPLIAFDATTGEELWREDPETLHGSLEFAIAGDTLYVADGTRVRALRES